MERLRNTAIACLGLLIVAIFSGCGGTPTVGVLLPMTGDVSPYGESMKQAVDLAIEEAQADGTYPTNLQLVWGDSASDPDTAPAPRS